MTMKRFIIELGTGADLHGQDVTRAACRAVRDAISRSCLCGLVEVLENPDLEKIAVSVVLASPRPRKIDLEKVKQELPFGAVSVEAREGGLETEGICVDRFARNCSRIVMVNAAVTVRVTV